MKTFKHLLIILLFCVFTGLVSCTEELPNVTGKNHLYHLTAVSGEDIDGHVKIRERFDKSIQLELVLNNTDPDLTYLAYMHFNNVLDGGGVALTLTPVDGHSQSSVTEIGSLDSGSTITYEELRQFDGHINIQLGDDPGTVVAQADIGLNALTGKFQQFRLFEGDIEGASGLLTFAERESGFSLVTVEITGGLPEKLHPVTLNFGSMFNGAGIAGTLNPVNGSIGSSQTHVERLDGDLQAPYVALVEFNGFARVHLGGGSEMNTILAEGNIAYVEN
ncbi:MAG: hypothetical protein DHS20C17_24240 [Cyclobacteriaceae bacterium]|nr:MAG: hypothetical protein DHS20C17_24240 [Cyclobacteriaceae bacterium]